MTMVLTAVGGVVAGGLIFLIVLSLTNSRSTEQARQATFRVGSAERLAPDVARDGPLLFQDLLDRSRDIYVQHLGGDNWVAFEAHAPGAPRRCVLEWRQRERNFVDPCDGRTFPADGAGLVAYQTEVNDDGQIIVDLTSPPTTSTSKSTSVATPAPTSTSTTLAA